MNVRFPTAALAALGFATLLLGACASQPRPLQGDFAEVSPYDAINIDSTGAMVRWGGRIVRTEPRPNHTCFEVLSTRLGSYGRPYWAGDDVGNRFIACRSGYYDPSLFMPDRDITFAGRIDGYENRRIGQYDYRLPRISADVVYLWPVYERADVITRPAPWPWWGYW